MEEFFFKENKIYGFGVDTYFDEGVLFESFLRYINEYKYFDLYNKIDSEQHAERHWIKLASVMQEKFNEASILEGNAINLYGSLRSAIQKGMFHPL